MNKLAVIAGIMALGVASSQAALLSWSASAPTVDGADIANFIGVTADLDNVNNGGDAGTYIANNQPWVGQTFTTGGNVGGYQLNAITLQHVQYSADTTWWSVDAGWVGFGDFSDIGVGTVSGGTFNRIGTAENADMTVTGNAALDAAGTQSGLGTGMYFTMTLNTPIALSANTTYAFTVNSSNPFLEVNGSDIADNYIGGDAFSVDRNDGVTVTDYAGQDHVFHLDMQAIPEPATMGLVGVFGAGILFTRRRIMM